MGKKSPNASGNASEEIRRIEMESRFLDDLRFWIESDGLRPTIGHRKVALRIMSLVDAVVRDPFTGIGKPEPLKYLL